jgi:nuclear transport factor 2 (NTF2) superfamily protein
MSLGREALLERMYAAFNARHVEAVLAAMTADVAWPNGWEGGVVQGREAVGDYWRRQWAEIDPTVTPEAFEALPDGRLAARVRQIVRDRGGVTLSDQVVIHTYSFRDGLIATMEIRKSP